MEPKKKSEGRRQSRKLRRTLEFSLAHDPQRAFKGWDATNRVPDLQPPWENDMNQETSIIQYASMKM